MVYMIAYGPHLLDIIWHESVTSVKKEVSWLEATLIVFEPLNITLPAKYAVNQTCNGQKLLEAKEHNSVLNVLKKKKILPKRFSGLVLLIFLHQF